MWITFECTSSEETGLAANDLFLIKNKNKSSPTSGDSVSSSSEAAPAAAENSKMLLSHHLHKFNVCHYSHVHMKMRLHRKKSLPKKPKEKVAKRQMMTCLICKDICIWTLTGICKASLHSSSSSYRGNGYCWRRKEVWTNGRYWAFSINISAWTAATTKEIKDVRRSRR